MAAQGLQRLQGEQRALLVAVAVLERVVLVEHAAGAKQVPGEGDALAVDAADEHAAAVGVALGRDDLELHVAPGECLVVLEVGVDRHVLRQREKSVAVVVVVVDALVLPEEFGLLEEMAFVLGHGDLGAMFPEASGSPGLVAVVVGVEDPLDLPDADFLQVVDEGAGAGVDEDGAVAGGYAVGVAGVGEAEDAGGDLGPGHGGLGWVWGVGAGYGNGGRGAREEGLSASAGGVVRHGPPTDYGPAHHERTGRIRVRGLGIVGVVRLGAAAAARTRSRSRELVSQGLVVGVVKHPGRTAPVAPTV